MLFDHGIIENGELDFEAVWLGVFAGVSGSDCAGYAPDKNERDGAIYIG